MANHHALGDADLPFLLMVFLYFRCLNWYANFGSPFGGLFPVRTYLYPRDQTPPPADFILGGPYMDNARWQPAPFMRPAVPRVGYSINPTYHIHMLNPNQLPRYGLVETDQGLFLRPGQSIRQHQTRSAFVRVCPPRNPRRFASPVRVPACRPDEQPFQKEKEN